MYGSSKYNMTRTQVKIKNESNEYFSLENIIFAILYNFWPILTRQGIEKQNYPTHLSQYLQTLNKSVVSYLIKILFRWLIRLSILLKNNTNKIYTKMVKNQIKILSFNIIFVCYWLKYILQFYCNTTTVMLS
jgi:hypothetical protein